MKHFVYFVIVFILVSLFYLIFVNPKRIKNIGKKKVNSINFGEVGYVVGKFKLDSKKLNLKGMIYTIGFINAFIMAFVCMVIAAIPLKTMFRFLIGFVLTFGLIYSIYEIYGHILVKIERSKKESSD